MGMAGYVKFKGTPSDSAVVDSTTTVSVEILGNIVANAIGLTPEVLAKGVTILGVEGSYEGVSE